MAPAQRLADGAGSSIGKKKRSRSRRNSDNDDDDGDVASKSQKKQPAAPAMSAVAARKLALMKEQEKQQKKQEASKNTKDKGREQDKDAEEDARIYTANAPSQDDAGAPTESEETQEISALNDILDEAEQEEDDDGNDSDNVPPVASTSKKPAEKRSKRYFSANPIESAQIASDVDTEAVDDTNGPNTSYSEPSTPLRPRRRAKRRRRGDDYKNAYFDPDCVSSWKPILQQNCFSVKHQQDSSQKGYIVAMQPGETLMMKGIASLRILRGTVSIDCGVLDSTSQPMTIFAPTTHPLPVLRASHTQSSSSALSSSLQLPPDIHFDERLETYPVVILVQDTQTGIEGIEGVARTAGMPVPVNGFWTSQFTGPQSISGNTFELITQPERDITATLLPDNWVEGLAIIDVSASEQDVDMSEGDIYIVQGPKGVGKSTFSKMLVNRLLSTHDTVAYLECDIGQTELTPPGLVSLHLLSEPIIGPAFTQTYRLHQSVRAHYLGSVSPKNNPSLNLASIQDLLSQFSSLRDTADAPLPLVINTQGWVKGLGADLLAEIHRMANPSRIFDFSAPPDPSSSFSALPQAESSTTPTIYLQPMSQPADHGPTRLNPADLRNLNLISYLHLEANQTPSERWNFTRSLVTQNPFVVPWRAFKQIRLLSSEHIVYEELLNALDVSVVSLESLDDAQLGVSEQSLAYDPHSPLQAPSGTCLGLGIIRAIDRSASAFHILSNLPSDALDKVNSISKGDLELPTVLMIDYIGAPDDQEGVCGVPWKDVPYLESREDQQAGVGYSKRRIRRNVMRRSQFR